jgi:hypothetical protein
LYRQSERSYQAASRIHLSGFAFRHELGTCCGYDRLDYELDSKRAGSKPASSTKCPVCRGSESRPIRNPERLMMAKDSRGETSMLTPMHSALKYRQFGWHYHGVNHRNVFMVLLLKALCLLQNSVRPLLDLSITPFASSSSFTLQLNIFKAFNCTTMV